MSRIREYVGTRVSAAAPWRDDVSSTVVIVQGCVALALGIYFLFATRHAVGTLAQIIGAYMAGVAVFHLALAVWRPADLAARPPMMLRRAIGLIAGSIALLSPWIGAVSSQDARLLVAGALVLGGIITIGGSFTDRMLKETRWAGSLSGVVEVAIGVGFYVITDSDRPLLNWLGIVMIVAGAVLIGRAILVLRPGERSESVE